MMIKKIKALKITFDNIVSKASFGQISYDISQLIAPQNKGPYYPSYDFGQAVEKKDYIQIETLFKDTLSILADPQENIDNFKKKLKNMKPSEFNIVSDNGIEWGLKEKLLMTADLMSSSNLRLVVSNDQSHQQILQKGYLEVYGVSPYRHLNKWIHEYEYTVNDMQIRFKERDQEASITQPNQKEVITDSLTNVVKEENQKNEGIMVKTKNAFFKFNKLFVRKKAPQVQNTKLPNMKELLRNAVQPKESHILVRDYEIETDVQIFLQRKDTGQTLQEDQWVDYTNTTTNTRQMNTFYLRTETLIDPKESISLKLHKSIVLTDFNWVMRGNPQVWIYRFDLQQ